MSLTPRSLLIPILVLIVGVILSASHSVLSAKEKMQIPDDFGIYLHSAGRIPMSSAATLTIEPNGHCKYYKRSRGPGKKLELKGEFDLSPEALEKIYKVIKEEKFFDLKPKYSDPDIKDGDFADMQITADGKKHQVQTVNIKVDAFDKIVSFMNSQLPEGMRIKYNALHVDDYKRVKR